MLEVDNGRGTDSVPLTIGQPDQGPIGQLHVNWVSVKPEKIAVGKPMAVRYTVLSAVAPAVDVDLVLDGTPGVADATTLADDHGKPVPDSVPMEAGDTLTVNVLVKRVPDLKAFTLSLTAKSGDIVGNDTRKFVIDQQIPPADPAISFLTGVLDVPDGSGELHGSAIRLSDRSSASLEVVVRLREPGDYEISIGLPQSLVDPVTGWVVVLAEPDPAGPAKPLVGEFRTVTQDEIEQDGFADRTVVLSFRRLGADGPQSVVLGVRRTNIRTDIRGRGAQTTYTLEPIPEGP
jgi:hypothetical protein